MRRFRIRLSLQVTIIVTAFLIVTFWVLTPWIIHTVTNQAKQSLISQTKSYAILATNPIGEAYILYNDSGTTLLNQRIKTLANLNNSVTNIALFDVQGNLLYSLNPNPEMIGVDKAEIFEPEFINDEEGYVRQVIYPYIEGSGAHRYTLVYDVSATEIKTVLSSLTTSIFLIAVGAVIVIDILILLLLERLFIRPLKRISQLALTIRAGQYDTRITTNRQDEIGELANSIDNMAKRLQDDFALISEADKMKSEFLIISSHNLRTPLTVVTGYVDILKSMPLDDTAKNHVLQIEHKAKELTDLTNDMLMVAELEGKGKPRLQLQTVDLALLLKDMEPEIQQRLGAKSLEFKLSVPDGQVPIVTQATYLQTILWNVLDNAIKFTPDKGMINLTLQHDTNDAHVIIKDTGVGISPEELPKLFTKFHRGTSLMEYQFEGVGLGLYMTKLMLELLGGSIKAHSVPGMGSTFTITLPKS